MLDQPLLANRLDEIEVGACRPRCGGVLAAASVLITSAGSAETADACRRSAFRKVSPSICGMLTSTIARSNGFTSTFSRASTPFSASSTSKPARSSASR